MIVADRIDRSADRALFRQLADIIRAQITSGDLAPGQDLPTETALAYEHEVGRDTVRDALQILRNEGLVVSERGRPARVRDRGEVQVVTLRPGDRVDYSGGGTVVVTRADGSTETYSAGEVTVVGSQ